MDREPLVYTLNLSIGAVLAALLFRHWRRAERDPALGAWMLAAVVITAASVLFAMRPVLPYAVGRFAPTLLVTVAQGVLFLAAERVSGGERHRRAVGFVVVVHAMGLAGFLALGMSSWRTVTNGLVWGGLSLAACVQLRRSTPGVRSAFAIPAVVFLAHGLFHAWRITSAGALAVRGDDGVGNLIQVLGDLEASVFMVALFVSVLLAHLELRNEALQVALADVHLLSGMLPVCAWCRRVRNDDGYWTQIEQYLSARSRMEFTHGICEECAHEHMRMEPAGEAGVVTGPTVS